MIEEGEVIEIPVEILLILLMQSNQKSELLF